MQQKQQRQMCVGGFRRAVVLAVLAALLLLACFHRGVNGSAERKYSPDLLRRVVRSAATAHHAPDKKAMPEMCSGNWARCDDTNYEYDYWSLNSCCPGLRCTRVIGNDFFCVGQ